MGLLDSTILEARFSIDPRNRGVLGDGSTTDAAKLQAILNGIEPDAQRREVVLRGGEWAIDNLSIPSGVRLIGTDGAKLVNVAAAANASGHSWTHGIYIAPGVEDVVIEGLEIDGNASAQTTTVYGIFVAGASRVKIRDCYIHDTQRTGIVVDGGSTDVTVADCRVDNSGFFGIVGGFYVNETDPITRLTVRDCRIDVTANGGSALGIIVSKADGVTASPGGIDCVFTDNTITRSDHDGIAAYSPNNVRLIVARNIVDNTGFTPSVGGAGGHLTHVGGTDLIVEGNIGRNIDGAGIVVSNFPNGAPPVGTGAQIIGNTINGTVQTLNGEGIVTQNYSDVQIVGNRCIGCAQEGIHVIGNFGGVSNVPTGITIAGNHCIGNGKAGLYVEEAAKVSVTGGSYRSNGTTTNDAGIRFKGVISSAISGAVCSDNTLDGVRMVDGITSSCLDVSVTGCTFANNGGWGIQATGSSNRILASNNTHRSNSSGSYSIAGAASGRGVTSPVSMTSGHGLLWDGSNWVDTALATTADVATAVANLVNSAPGALDTLGELATQLANDESAASALTTSLAAETTRATAAEAALAGLYVPLLDRAHRYDAATAGTFLMLPDSTTAGITASNGAAGRTVFYIDPADWALSGKTVKLRLSGLILVNATNPASDFTFGLYPVSAVAGAAATVSVTLGAVAAQVAFTSGGGDQPTANQMLRKTTEFTCPAAGWYTLGLIIGSNMAASSSVVARAQLRVREV